MGNDAWHGICDYGLVSRNQAIENWNSPLAKVIFLKCGMDRPTRQQCVARHGRKPRPSDPFFLASYGIEYLVIKFTVRMPEGGSQNLAYPRVRIAVRNAKLITYGAMFVATSV
jgi:hypothetical protein